MRTCLSLGLATAILTAGTAAGTHLAAQAPDQAFLSNFQWRSVGPTNMSGRVTDVEGVPGTATFYVAAAAGGIWKTTNNGTTFKPVFDDQRVIAMGDIAIAPSDPNVLYAGTGEEDSRNSISPGGGVYRSTDAGASWRLMGLEGTQAIGRIVVHPDDPNTVWVAALGQIWGHSEERGLYKSTDGGETWRKVKHISDKAGFVDLVMDPRNPDVLWAASWERVRGPWFLNSGGPGSGLWKSTDGGERWTEVEGNGFPETTKGRIGIAISQSEPDRMYAIVEAESGDTSGMSDEEAAASGLKGNGLYRSDDGGRTWRWMNGENTRPFYYSQVRVDPSDPDIVIWSSTPVRLSKDGGKTVGQTTVDIHVDHHALWWDPTNPDHFIVGNDGGIAVTWDKGGAFDFINTFPIGQFYHVSYNMDTPYRVCGGMQDNGTWCGPSRRGRGGIDHHMWYTINGGDGFYSQQDPTNPDIVYAESQGGSMARIDMATGERNGFGRPDWEDRVRPMLDSIAVYEGVEAPREMTRAERRKVDAWKEQVRADSAKYDLRYNWNTPIVLSPHDPSVVYAAGNRVIKSTDRGDSFEVISPDLSNGDEEKIRVSTQTTGGITPDVTGAETYATIVTLAESPLAKGMLIAGTDDGNVWVTRNDGGDWQQIDHRRFRGLPRNTYVSRVEPSHHDANRFYVTFDGHRTNDFTPYVYVTDNGGRDFRSIASNLPTGAPDFVHVVREDMYNPDLLFVGTDVGAYVSLDRGQSWQKFMNGLPTVPVHDLQIHPRDRELIAGTHGRSIWIVDIAPLQQPNVRTMLAGTEPVVFAPAAGLQFADRPSGGESTGHRYFEGTSVPQGVELMYYVPEGAEIAVAASEGEAEADGNGSGQRPAREAAMAGMRQGQGRPGAAGERGQARSRGPQAEITITDAAGETVATLTGPASSGMLHRVRWNMRPEQEEQEPPAKSPSELRDSINAQKALAEIADSLVANEGADREAIDRALEMMRSGNMNRLFGGGGRGGGAQFDPDRPGERYPVAQPERETPQTEVVRERMEQQGPDMEAVQQAARDLFGAIRERGVRGFSFRRFFGGGGGPQDVAPGTYTVTVKIGDRTYTQNLEVVRSPQYDVGNDDEAEAAWQAFLEWLGVER